MTLATCQWCKTLVEASSIVIREYVQCNQAACLACAYGVPPTPGQVIAIRDRIYARFPFVGAMVMDSHAQRVRVRRSEAFAAELRRLGWLRRENEGYAGAR